MTYATKEDVERGFRTLTADEADQCDALLEEAALLIDSYHSTATDEAKKIVSCRMIRRMLGDGASSQIGAPVGASQGSMSALGYAQTWTMASGSVGEIYLSKTEKKMLGIGERIGSHSPLEDLSDGNRS